MSSNGKTDWNPETYARFRGLRLRPALDLMMQIGTPGAGAIVDLGCGDGAAAASLRARFPKRRLIGLDASPAMLASARGYDATVLADAATWVPDEPVGVIYSNAALHWLPDHAALLPRLAGFLPRNGVLAVQMPGQHGAPSHRLAREVAERLYPEIFDFSDWSPAVAMPADYHRMLAPLGAVSAWETEYIQRLEPHSGAHPVRRFTESTMLRPILEKLGERDHADYLAAYEPALAEAYPLAQDGSVLFPFRRVFFVLTRPS